jgi:hypothetical protein
MRPFSKSNCLLIATALPLMTQASTEASAPSPAETFKSVFISDPAFGKDPFFPKSTRRPVLKPQPPPTDTVVRPPEFPETIHLKGISLGAGRKLALVNYYTFAEGEEADLRLDGQVVRVQCLEIKERSVVVMFRGIRKELQLRQGL